MKRFFKFACGKGETSRAFRLAIISILLVYVLIMIAMYPTMVAVAEVSDAKIDIFSYDNTDSSSSSIDIDNIKELPHAGFEKEKDIYNNEWSVETGEDVYVIREDTSKRTANEKHFLMSDGSYTLISYPTNIHFLENGTYKEIDNSLIKQNGKYVNNANILEVELPEKYLQGSAVIVKTGHYSLSFSLKNYFSSQNTGALITNNQFVSTVSAEKDHTVRLNNESSVRYNFASSAIELEHILIGTQLKENIIVKNKLNDYNFKFEISSNNLNLVVNSEGDIIANSLDGRPIFKIPKGFMYDSAGNYSEAVNYNLTGNSTDGYILEVIADKTWINDAQRKFPVTIDPSVEINDSSVFISASRGTVTTDNLMPVSSESVSFIDFDLPTSLGSATIINAQLRISAKKQIADDYAYLMSVWANNTSFSADTAPGKSVVNVPNPTDPGKQEERYVCYFDDETKGYKPDQELLILSNELQHYYIDITRGVKNFVDFSRQSKFYGFAFKGYSTNNIFVANEKYADVNHRPYVQIQYRNIIGLESYWDYDQYTVGENDVFLNKYNGALTIVHNDAEIASEFPINVQHIYLSNYANENYNVDGIFADTGYGLGWKLNYQQVIRYRDGNFEYYDADGTMHYFWMNYEKGYCEDEDGLGLKLYGWNGFNHRIIDQDNTVYYFDLHGRLFKIEDKNHNAINILYGTGNQGDVSKLPITEINDGRGHKITFSYSESGLLENIVYKKADGQTTATTSFNYFDNGKLNRIVNDDFTYTEYQYDETAMSLIKTESNYQIKIIRDAVYAAEDGIVIRNELIDTYTAKAVSVRESVDGINWRHIRDNIFCDGLTMSVEAIQGKDYIPYKSYAEFAAQIKKSLDDAIAKSEDLLKFVIFTLGIGYVALLVYLMQLMVPLFIEEGRPYYEENFIIKNVYDRFGRLVSSYIDDEDTITSVDVQYNSEGGINNNKIAATATYSSNVVNMLENGSFENGVTGWQTGETGGNPYKNTAINNHYTAHGKNALEIFIAQPVNYEYITTQNLSLEPGIYTLSANVMTRGLLVPYSSNVDYGAKIRVRGIKESEYINADIYTANNGFKYLTVDFELTAATDVNIDLVLANCSGFAYFDAVQLTKTKYGSDIAYNNSVNAGFEEWSGDLPVGWYFWTDSGASVTDSIIKLNSEDTLSGNHGVMLKGNLYGSINLFQTVPIPISSQSTAYTVSVWANNKGASYFPLTSSVINLNYNVKDASGNSITGFVGKSINLPFALWHQVTMSFIAPPNAAMVEINLQIWGSTTELMLDNVSLVRSQIVNLTYDGNGKNTGYSDGYVDYEYDENGNAIQITKDGEDEYNLTKDENGNVLTSKDCGRNVQTEYTYDDRGRVLTETFSSLTDGKKVTSSLTYAEINDNLFTTVTNTDSLGFSTISDSYTYSSLLKKTTFNDGSYVEYEYSDGTTTSGNQFPSKLKKIIIKNKNSSGVVLSSCEYEYFTIDDNVTDSAYGYRHVGMLKSVKLPNGTTYSYIYDAWGNTIGTKLNGVIQSSYAYSEKDGTLLSKTMGDNGYTEYYYYDILGRTSEIRATASKVDDASALADDELVKHVYFKYDLKNNLVELKDTIANKGYWYDYDINGRCILSGEGIYSANDDLGIISTETIFETLYDVYGDVHKVNTIDLTGTHETFGISGTTALNGVMARIYPAAEEIVYVDGVKKIHSYLNTDGYSVKETNAFWDKTIFYNYNELGKIDSFIVANGTAGSASGGILYKPFYNFRTSRYIYDVESGNLWDREWALQNQNPDNGSFSRAIAVEDSTFNGEAVTEIIRLVQENYYSTYYGYYSLVDPALLKLSGDDLTMEYLIRRVSPSSANPQVAGLRFRYTDGTSTSRPFIPMDSEWHHYSISCEEGKTVAAIELPWYYGETLEIGNVIIKSSALGKIDNRIAGIDLESDDYVSYEYDSIGRLTSAVLKQGRYSNEEILTESYGYLNGEGDITTYTVNGITLSRGDTVIADYGYIYNMHAGGAIDVTAAHPYNIYQIKENGTVKAEYYYDGLGRLARENNSYSGKTVVYAYDTNNNIVSKTVYPFTAGNGTLSGGTVISYAYGDSNFKDRLTSYNGQSIIYDNGASNGIGLPTTYLGKTMQWFGRELIGISEGTNSFAYSYDVNGIRLSKTINGVATEFLYSGTQLLRQVTGNNTIWFIYDQDGMIGFELNGTPYYYLRNLLSDVTGIIDANGNVVVNYTYDSWGKLLSVTGSQANTVGALNPIRYRGYYYDAETGFYYLNSRYYDAETGRFISPDVLSEDGNLYSYCQNDPINRSDESGYLSKFWKRIIKIAVGVVATVAAVAITVATGGAALPVVAGVVASTVIGGVVNGAVQAANGGDFSEGFLDGAADGLMWGGIFALGGSLINAAKVTGSAVKASANAVNRCGNIGGQSSKSIVNDIIGKPRVGSALKTDAHHAFPDIIDNYAGYATKSFINNNAVKYELTGSLNGKIGVFEWMLNDSGEVFHRFFRVIVE